MSLYFHFFIVASPHDGVIVSDFVGVDETSSVKERDGGVVSIVKESNVTSLLSLLALSVTLILQSVYVPSLKLFNVIVVSPLTAFVVAVPQLPDIDIVPASFDVRTKPGVLSFVGVGICVLIVIIGGVVSDSLPKEVTTTGTELFVVVPFPSCP